MFFLRYVFTILVLFFSVAAFAQEREIEGMIIDKETQFRITRVKISNLNSKRQIFNDSRGEFRIAVKNGEKILAEADGYYKDTLIYSGQSVLIFRLKKMAILLKEIEVKDSVTTARKKYEETRKEFHSLKRLGNNEDILSIGSGGVGVSIDAIWSAFSREGRNARKLIDVINRDYMNNFIDERFNKKLVVEVTGLNGDKLEIFMKNYRPSYYFVYGANEYDLISYIKMAYIRFQKDPFPEDISNLKPIEE